MPDDDLDLVIDSCDNCPSVSNPSQANDDGDINGDACDLCPGFDDALDVDGDTVPNLCDNCQSTPNLDQANSDTDTIGDVCDNCPLADNQDQLNLDNDSHGFVCDNCPAVDNEDQLDADGDINGDLCDLCPGSDDAIDTNGNGIPDGCEITEIGCFTLNFDGVDDYVTMSGFVTPLLQTTTVEVRAKLTGGAGTVRTGLSTREALIFPSGFRVLAAAENTWQLEYGDNLAVGFQVLQGPPVTEGQWTHLAALLDLPGGLVLLSIDGLPVARTTSASLFPLIVPSMRFGADTVTSADFFVGRIDEVRTWDYVRGPAEILADMNRRLVGDGTEAGLMSYWPMDEGTGLTAQDSCGGDHGTLVNGTAWMPETSGLQGCTAGPACATAADCADIDGNGVTDDVCVWWECVAGTCFSSAKSVPSDVGGALGACPLDTFCNLADALHALTCFAGTNSCEPINIDAGGALGACAPDGFCNLADALHALTCFAGDNACGCAPSPEFLPEPDIVGSTSLSAEADREVIEPGDEVQVRIFVDEALPSFRAYQLHAIASGGRAGSLELVNITIEDRDDSAFVGVTDVFDAFNVETAKMLAGLFDGDVAIKPGEYLATFTYRVSRDAGGTFVVDLLHESSNGNQAFLVGARQTDKIEIAGTQAAAITIASDGRHSIR